MLGVGTYPSSHPPSQPPSLPSSPNSENPARAKGVAWVNRGGWKNGEERRRGKLEFALRTRGGGGGRGGEEGGEKKKRKKRWWQKRSRKKEEKGCKAGKRVGHEEALLRVWRSAEENVGDNLPLPRRFRLRTTNYHPFLPPGAPLARPSRSLRSLHSLRT